MTRDAASDAGTRWNAKVEAEAALLESLVESTVFTPINAGSAMLETVARLGEAIMLGLLRNGDQLPPEPKLAEALKISPVTLRGALAILREAKLVQTRRGRGGGTFVSASVSRRRAVAAGPPSSHEQMRDLVDFRAVLEGGTCALAAERVTGEQLEQLEALVSDMSAEGDFSRWSELDTLFHLALARASGSRRLVPEVAKLRNEAHRISSLYHPVSRSAMRLSNDQHRDVLAAARAHEPERARAAMVAHVESTLALWLGLEQSRWSSEDRLAAVGRPSVARGGPEAGARLNRAKSSLGRRE
jgi:GntR family transcriptional regulator, transcriptional repressor for pyruvate dehydrogenase complex